MITDATISSSLVPHPELSLLVRHTHAAVFKDVFLGCLGAVRFTSETLSGVAKLRRVGTNHDVVLGDVGVADDLVDEPVGLLLRDIAVDPVGLSVGAVGETVHLICDHLAVDDVADACVTPQRHAAAVDVGIEHPFKQLVGLGEAERRDDVPGVHAHVVAEHEDASGVDGVVGNTRGVLPGHLAGLDEHTSIRDDQFSLALLVEVNNKFSGHVCSLVVVP